jgi:hypothetical protein
MKNALWKLAFAFILLCSSVHAQNVIVSGGNEGVVDPAQIGAKELMAVLETKLNMAIAQQDAQFVPANHDAERVARKLEAHILEFVEGYPFLPFHNTLGISGYETYFGHPDQMFYSLSLAVPLLSKPAAEKVRAFLSEQLSKTPPYTDDGLDVKMGKPRESYSVPQIFRVNSRTKATSAFGIYAFVVYCQHVDTAAGINKKHWDAIKSRMADLLSNDYKFDISKKDYSHDDAQKLNGDLSACMATVLLARLNKEGAVERQAMARAQQLLGLRVNLERVNPRILEKTESTTQHLHAAKLSRYCDLSLPIARALRDYTEGCGLKRLKAFREERNGWYLAFGDRYIGGENYTSPPHFARATFAGAALLEELPAEQLLSFVDVPWCKGDLYFIEKCAYALAAGSKP